MAAARTDSYRGFSRWLNPAQLARTWDLLLLMTAREVKVRYQGTVLGLLWTQAKPLLLALVLYFALNRVLGIKGEGAPYHLFLLAALFPWTWFQSSIQFAAPSFANNAPLLKKVYFPRFVLPLSTVTNQLFHFVLSIPILMLLLLVDGRHPGLEWLLGIPLLIVVQLLMLAGAVLVVASFNVFLRDLEHLVEVFLNLWFYLTPILYPLSRVPESVKPLLLVNPMTSLVEAWRDLFLKNELPSAEIWPALVFTAVILVAGALVFKTLEGRFEDAL